MYNELKRHKKSDTVKWIAAFVLIAVLLAGMIASLILSVGKEKALTDVPQQTEEETPLLNGRQDSKTQTGAGLRLSSALITSETEHNTVLLTATVTPEAAENKAVDWTIEWQTPESEYTSCKSVTDYCTVTPASNGALTAKVQCLQPFEEYIDVKATTREGGYTAVCTLAFAGKPSGFTVSCAEVSPSGGYYNLGVGNLPHIYRFDLNLINEWNQVGDKFYDFTVEIKGYGEFIAQDLRKDTYDSEYYRVGAEKTIQAREWTNTFLEASISAEKKLEITPRKTVRNFGTEQVIMGGGRLITNEYKSGGDNVYFEVIIKTASGLSQTIKIKPVSAVSGITLNVPVFEF